ncbi:TIGR01457 family HAD-type hydrolase [Paenisporosarcina antarctica]|uniref:TIGR01457 family HAD-type hydrolase n=1 Tax=Paenisporosarcina antarctica TaxID=417367 RepID=A0A4V1AMV0_9BACL|nr:TIGR01457 family HAD-type hydrolase [Paenisporosarcina antarctica]QBP40545.1 TIGR01457 family HAD-type hydrolase [Paenisporosarcina antarctica]
MKAYKGYCIDLDGTVYRGKEPIMETVQFIQLLQEQGIEPFFVTNNASQTPDQVLKKLKGFGVDAKRSHIMTSAMAAAKYIALHYYGKDVSMIGDSGLREALNENGVNIVLTSQDVFVIGMDRGITYEKLAQACLDVRNGAVFISTNSDRAYPSERGFLPGNGAFTTLIQTSTGVDPIFIGKPQGHMLEIIQHEHQFAKEDMVMIGDNYDTDILAGIEFGIDTIHVNTGITSTEKVLLKSLRPTMTIQNLLDLV